MTLQRIQVYKVFHLSIFKEDHDDVYGVVVHCVVIITLTAIVCIMVFPECILSNLYKPKCASLVLPSIQPA